jgi:protein ImuB
VTKAFFEKSSSLTLRRYLVLHLPFLPTERLARSAVAPAEGAPFVLVEKQAGALRLCALNPAALREGLARGLSLSDARARLPTLVVAPADPAKDADILLRLAARCERYTPLTALDPPHGLALDISGCAPLFGGEAALLERLMADFAALGFSIRAALANTPDAARALARFGAGGLCPSGAEAEQVAPLPVAAMEAGPDVTLALRRAGLATIGALAARDPCALAARFGAGFPRKLGRLLGQEDVRLTPLRPPPNCMAERHFLDPVVHGEAIEAILHDLIADLAAMLERRGQGGRAFEASFFRADGRVRRLVVETLRPTRDAGSLNLLFRERVGGLADPLDPGFGFDAIRLAVLRAENLGATQGDFSGTMAQDAEQELSDLLDRLTTRFGRARVLRFVQGDRHDPESEAPCLPIVLAAAFAPAPWPSAPEGEPPARPLALFDPPEPIEVVAETPDLPPARFRWRRVQHDVVRAEGPERIAPAWHEGETQTRDYFRVEDGHGRRYWLFRRGLYEHGDPLAWFMHGLFA